MAKNDTTIQKATVDINLAPEQAPAPMPVDETLIPKAKPVKKQKDVLKESVQKVMQQAEQSIKQDTITQQDIDAWKIEYGSVYQTLLAGNVYFWHKMRRKDYINVMTDEDLSQVEGDLRIFMRQEKIVKTTVLYPDKDTLDQLMDENAGIAGNLSDEIMITSGFGAMKTQEL